MSLVYYHYKHVCQGDRLCQEAAADTNEIHLVGIIHCKHTQEANYVSREIPSVLCTALLKTFNKEEATHLDQHGVIFSQNGRLRPGLKSR